MGRRSSTVRAMRSHRMYTLSLAVALAALLGIGGSSPVVGQDLGDAGAYDRDNWTSLYREAGVHFSFIFYREGDNANNGVVVRIDNTNDHPVRYRFTMVFQSDSTRVAASPRSGVLAPGEMTTGSSDSLWWIPFEDGREISEVGMRGMEVSRVGPD